MSLDAETDGAIAILHPTASPIVLSLRRDGGGDKPVNWSLSPNDNLGGGGIEEFE